MSHVRIACNAKGTWRQRGWTGWWVWRLAGGKATGAGWWVGPLSNGEPFGAPPLKPLSSGERLRGSSLGPCPTRSALEPPRSAPDEGRGGERLGGSSLGPCRAGRAWNCFCTLKIIKPSLFSSGSARGAQNTDKQTLLANTKTCSHHKVIYIARLTPLLLPRSVSTP